jgi:hypothetical protein
MNENLNKPSSQPGEHPQTVPASSGLRWVLQSLALIRRQPARLLFLAVLLQLILGLSQVPVLGVLVILALPAFSAGMLEAFRLVETGQRWPASVLFLPLTRKPANGRFLLLGVVMFCLAGLTAMLVMGSSDARLETDLMQQIEQGNTEALAQLDPVLAMKVMLAALLAVSISGTVSFFAIPLIWFHDLPMARALLRGLQGMQRNWRAFLVLAVGLLALLFPLVLLFVLVLNLVSALGAASVLLAALVMLAGLLLQLVVLGTQYLACRDIFGLPQAFMPAGPDDGSDAGPDDGQLLA